MEIYLVPMRISGFSIHDVAIRLRKGENPALFMEDVQVTLDGYRKGSNDYSIQTALISIIGNIRDDVTLQDGDALLVQSKTNSLEQSVKVNLEHKDMVYISESVRFHSISMAARMEEQLCVCMADTKCKNTISTGVQIFNKAMELYDEFPAFRDIMIKDAKGVTNEVSLLSLVMKQDDNFIRWAETMILSMDSKYKTLFPVAKQILEQSRTDTGFTLLSQEEQVAAFLEFSKRHADKAEEIVTDELLEFLKTGPEYARSVEKLKQAGFGESRTQQFNVLQQVGYFGGFTPKIRTGHVIYNLSDMGAGKTLMTVQAIFMIDCIHIGVWNREPKNEYVEVKSVCLPDKHIIAPALSVKASWVDTFRLFYDVEKKTDYHYVLTAEFEGVTATSDLYIAPFTVRGGKVYVQETLPEPTSADTFLIIDEIHQLVRRRISGTTLSTLQRSPRTRSHVWTTGTRLTLVMWQRIWKRCSTGNST